MLRKMRLWAVLLLALLASTSLFADYGAIENYTIIGATSFKPLDSTTAYQTILGEVFRTDVGVNSNFVAPVDLPHGALLESLTFYVADDDGVPDRQVINVGLGKASRLDADGSQTALQIVKSTNTQGLTGYQALVIDYNNTLPVIEGAAGAEQINNWLVVVNLNAQTSVHRFSGVKLKWKRQVSPKPLTATFTDVPTTHPFHRFIEALYASGITAGCGNNQFCPDEPITRGQFAVFMSTALGLHWAP